MKCSFARVIRSLVEYHVRSTRTNRDNCWMDGFNTQSARLFDRLTVDWVLILSLLDCIEPSVCTATVFITPIQAVLLERLNCLPLAVSRRHHLAVRSVPTCLPFVLSSSPLSVSSFLPRKLFFEFDVSCQAPPRVTPSLVDYFVT